MVQNRAPWTAGSGNRPVRLGPRFSKFRWSWFDWVRDFRVFLGLGPVRSEIFGRFWSLDPWSRINPSLFLYICRLKINSFFNSENSNFFSFKVNISLSVSHNEMKSWTAIPYRKSVPVRNLVRGTDFWYEIFWYGTWYGAKFRKIEKNKGFYPDFKKKRSKIDIFCYFFLFGIPFQNPYKIGFFAPNSVPRTVPIKISCQDPYFVPYQ